MSNNDQAVRDRLNALIPTLSGFTAKTQLINAYDVEDNKDHLLKDGWGVKLESSSVVTPYFTRSWTQSRNFTVVITAQVVHLENSRGPIDTVENTFLGNIYTLQKAFLDDNQLNIGTNIGKVDFVGDTGFNFILKDKTKFATIEATFSFDIFESF